MPRRMATVMFTQRYKTIAVSLYADEAQKWKDVLGGEAYKLTLDTGKVVTSMPDDVTNDTRVAAQADAIVLAVPSFAHAQYFPAFAPHMKPNTVVVVMPARSGCDILFSPRSSREPRATSSRQSPRPASSPRPSRSCRVSSVASQT